MQIKVSLWEDLSVIMGSMLTDRRKFNESEREEESLETRRKCHGMNAGNSRQTAQTVKQGQERCMQFDNQESMFDL